MKGMVITVGLGEDVHYGIAQSIEAANPDTMTFVASSKSRETLGMVAQELERTGHTRLAELCVNEGAVVEVEDFENVDSCYAASVIAFKKLLERGLQPKHIVADFTSGTKAMSAGLVMAAALFGCETLSYVGGLKRNGAGRVITGSGQVHIGKPSIMLQDLTLRHAVEAFNHYQFRACRALIAGLKERVSTQLLEKAESLAVAADFYEAWDRFDHKAAAELRSELKQFDNDWGADTKSNRCFVVRIAGLLETSQQGGKDAAEVFVELAKSAGGLLMADLLANALRRGKEGRYDDAVARLYRVIELAAQVVLARDYNLHTSRISESFLSERGLQSKYASSSQQGYVKIGLRDAYELLADLGHELGTTFQRNDRLQKYLNSRNESILAHGLRAVGTEVYERLLDSAKQLCEQAVGTEYLNRELKNCEFPQLNWIETT
ncbi:MAG: TIGR02710 family CRISPR-associated CARF protein [Armatimonadota bacterium]|nr:TIGR02710 family CRISPR-associated CARF protein [Armatimonadota bacterium]